MEPDVLVYKDELSRKDDFINKIELLNKIIRKGFAYTYAHSMKKDKDYLQGLFNGDQRE
jgi:hypothetical protein